MSILKSGPGSTQFLDITGQRFGKLVALNYIGKRLWWCRCDCGKELLRCGKLMRTGKLKSCGCAIKDFNEQRHLKHGHSRAGKETRTYRIWLGMKQRCLNPIFGAHHGRGIRVCESWNNFPQFLADVGECPSDQHSLDRINNDGNYEPGNVRWATSAEQSRNQRCTRMITFKGKTQCLTDWCKELGISKTTFYHRDKRKLTIEQLLAPPRKWRSPLYNHPEVKAAQKGAR